MTPAEPSASTPMGIGMVRVATQNVWGLNGNWPSRRFALRVGLEAAAIDVLALQEVHLSNDNDQARQILGSDYEIVASTIRSADGTGCAIASRWPIRRVADVDQRTEADPDFPAVAQLVEVDIPPPIGAILFVNFLPSWQLDAEAERERQAVRTARAIVGLRSDRQRHIVVAGDLDADEDASSIRYWTGRQALEGSSVCYRDAWQSRHPNEPGETISQRNPLLVDWDWPYRRVDYILVGCGRHGGPTLLIKECERMFDAPIDGTWASDHFGVIAELAVPPELPAGL
jgi:endonuclease/exonuclease/phosphatase family metal-dependent hydrolase